MNSRDLPVSGADPEVAALDIAALQRRTLRVVVASQMLGGAGLAAGVTVGALLAEDMLDSTSFAGLPAALFTLGAAAAALLVGLLSQRAGRRAGLAAGYAAGALGGAGVVLAAVLDSVPLLLLAFVVYGGGIATNLQARYAGADLAQADHRGRAISLVLVATTIGAVAGPNLVDATGHLAEHVGIPPLAGPFGLAALAYALAGLVLLVWLRPDPLLVARALAADAERGGAAGGDGDGAARGDGSGPPAETAQIRVPGSASPEDPLRRVPGSGSDAAAPEPAAAPVPTAAPEPPAAPSGSLALAAVTLIVTQVVMAAIMTMTPIHMRDHGHGLGATGLVISIHIGCMYLPSPLTGWLADRYGRLPVIAAGGIVLLGAGLLAAVAPADSVLVLAVALGLLGLGWNLGLTGGTALVTDSTPVETRARTQGTVDLTVSLAGAAGGLTSGLVVASTSYALMSVAGGVLALAILPLVLRSARVRG